MLQVQHITVAAGRKGPVLVNDVSFQVPPGRLLVVLGANGAGKSTLLRAIGGEVRATRGTVQWKEKTIADIPLAVIARERAFLGQHSEVPFAFTAREVVMMGRYPHFTGLPSSADEDAVDRAMMHMHIEALQHRPMPSLSGGERKRVHIARVMAQLDNGDRTSLLLMDEPLNDLDVKHQLAVMEHARAYAEAGHCVVAVLHDVNLASRYAHRILLMGHGRTLALGEPRDVLVPELLEQAYGMPAHVLPHPVTGAPWVHFGEGLAATAIDHSHTRAIAEPLDA
jgi:iron complex transport system ATP-binding protein